MDANLNYDLSNIPLGSSLPISDSLTVDTHGNLIDLLHFIPIEILLEVKSHKICCRKNCSLCPNDHQIDNIRERILSVTPCTSKSISLHGTVIDLSEFFPKSQIQSVKNFWTPICPSSCNVCPVSSHPSWIRKTLSIKKNHPLRVNHNYLNQDLRKPETPDEDIDLHGIIFDLKSIFPANQIKNVKKKCLPICILECESCPTSSYPSTILSLLTKPVASPDPCDHAAPNPPSIEDEEVIPETLPLKWLIPNTKPQINDFFHNYYFKPNPNLDSAANGTKLPKSSPVSSFLSYAEAVSGKVPCRQDVPSISRLVPSKTGYSKTGPRTILHLLPYHPNNRPQIKNKPRCFKCGDLGHAKINCRDPTICFRCGRINHSARSCPLNIKPNLIQPPLHAKNLTSFTNHPIKDPISSTLSSSLITQLKKTSPGKKMSASSPSISTTIPFSIEMQYSIDHYNTWGIIHSTADISNDQLLSVLPTIWPQRPDWQWSPQKINRSTFRIRFPSTQALTRALLPRSHDFPGFSLSLKVWRQHSGAVAPSFTPPRWFKIWNVPDFVWSRFDIQKLAACLGSVEEYPLLRFPPPPQPYRRICIRPFNLSPFPTSLYLHVADLTFWCPIEMELEATLLGPLPPDVMADPLLDWNEPPLQFQAGTTLRPHIASSSSTLPQPSNKRNPAQDPSTRQSKRNAGCRSLIANFGNDPRAGILGSHPKLSCQKKPLQKSLNPAPTPNCTWKARRIHREECKDPSWQPSDESISSLHARTISFTPPCASGITTPHSPTCTSALSPPHATSPPKNTANPRNAKSASFSVDVIPNLAMQLLPPTPSPPNISISNLEKSLDPQPLQTLMPLDQTISPLAPAANALWIPDSFSVDPPLAFCEWQNPTLANLKASLKMKNKLKNDFDELWNILSWNVRGLGANKKLYKVRDRLNLLKPEILCLQETKLQIINSFCFNKFTPSNLDQWESRDAIGSSGGILTCWDSRIFEFLSVIRNTFSLTITLKDRRSNLTWRITNVYGPCISNLKKAFWSELSQLGSSYSPSCWLIGGDFNSTVSSSDRNSLPNSSKISKSFVSFINKFNLLDIPLEGRRFTWSNLQSSPSLVKLDRFLISSAGWDSCPHSHCSGYPRYLSDHSPIEFSSTRSKGPHKPFKLNPSLLGLANLDQQIRLLWTSFSPLPPHLRLKKIKKHYKKYSKENFKPIHLEKARLMDIIHNLDLAEESAGSLSAANSLERNQAKSHLANILETEENIWKIRSKALWIKNGDKNTKFYHRMASYRNKLNFISRITTPNSEITSPPLIHETIRKHFQTMYAAPLISLSPTIEWSLLQCPVLSPLQAARLVAPINHPEIKKAIWAMPEDKSPGPDGFPIRFFKHFWETLKSDILKLMLDFQDGNLDLTPLNQSFITLIPKCEGASDLKDFRPICLQNSITKIISKILAERMKEVLGSLISDSQSAYLKDRSLAESFALALEAIHSSKKFDVKGVLLKLDFSKAFDSLRWDFLLHSLQSRGFCPKWISWISYLLSSSSISVLLNGQPSKPFSIFRGVRQGDPLSAYLFILATDSLSRMINLAMSSNIIKGIPLNPNNQSALRLSHLQYADDTVIFSSHHPSSIFFLKAILHFFGQISGLSLNLAKTTLIGLNLSASESISLADLFGCKCSVLPINYLGLPLRDSKLKRNDWSQLSSKISSRLSTWKAQPLSISGRVILINSVLSALPIHFMSLFLLPSWLTLEIDKVRRNFLWSGQSSLPKKIHQVAWKVVCKSPLEGGLGIKNLKLTNISLLLKWWWKLLYKPCQWSTAIAGKYYQRRLPLDLNIRPSKSSHVWRSVLKLGQTFKASLRWSLGNGKSIAFWVDKWGPSLSLKLELPNLFLSARNPNSKVASNYNSRYKSWALKLFHPLSREAALEYNIIMQKLDPFSLSSVNDSPICSWLDDPPSPKPLYELLNLSGVVWKHYIIWSLPSPPKIKVFLWLILKGKCNTKDNLSRRGMNILDPGCAFCPELETSDHLFFNCPQIHPNWTSFGIAPSESHQNISLDTLWSSWRSSLSVQARNLWDKKAPALMWVIWTERNNRIFSNLLADPRSLHQSALEVMSSWDRSSLL